MRAHRLQIGDHEWCVRAPALVRDLWDYDVELVSFIAGELDEYSVLAIWEWVSSHAISRDAVVPRLSAIQTDELIDVARGIYECAFSSQSLIWEVADYIDTISLADLFDPTIRTDAIVACECWRCAGLDSGPDDCECLLARHSPRARTLGGFYRLAMGDPRWLDAPPSAYILAMRNREAESLGFSARDQIRKAESGSSPEWVEHLASHGIDREVG